MTYWIHTLISAFLRFVPRPVAYWLVGLFAPITLLVWRNHLYAQSAWRATLFVFPPGYRRAFEDEDGAEMLDVFLAGCKDHQHEFKRWVARQVLLSLLAACQAWILTIWQGAAESWRRP